MVTDITRTEDYTKGSKEVLWVIHDFGRRVEEADILFSDVFDFGGQLWQIVLQNVELLDARYISFTLSRVTNSSEDLLFSRVLWHAGIVDRDGTWQYDRSRSTVVNTACKEWVTAADWFGPEWTCMSHEKDLYMPDDRLTIAVQLRLDWGQEVPRKDPEGTLMKQTTDNLMGKDHTLYFKRVYWMIVDLQQRLEESTTLLSEVFHFGGQHWRMALQSVELLDARYINVALTRVTISSERPPFPLVLWHAGIFDRDRTFQYDRRGSTRLDTTCKEWMKVVDWPGPEMTYLSQKKDLYMPDDRFTVAVELRWDSNGIWMDPQGTKIGRTAGNISIKEEAQHFRVFWRVSDFHRQLEELDHLQSNAIYFGSQNWRLLLHRAELMDSRFIRVSLSRTDASWDRPFPPFVWWQAGILDGDEVFHYDASGWVKLGTPCEEWTTVAEWTGPEWTYIFQKKDLLMPRDQLTVSIVFNNFGPFFAACEQTNSHAFSGLSSAESNPKLTYMPGKECDVVLKVRDRTFRAHRWMLEIFSPVMAAMLYPGEEDGENEVLQLTDCDTKAFEIFLSFAYSGTLDGLTNDKIQHVYYIADTYVVPGLKEECVRRLLATLSVDSVCSVLALADSYSDEELLEKTIDFFVTNASTVFLTNKWLRFTVTHTKLANDLIVLSHLMGS